jgi:hypothetical protein
MSSTDTPDGLVITNARLPVAIHRQLAKAAKKACRSLNSELVFRLRESLRADSNRGREERTAGG